MLERPECVAVPVASSASTRLAPWPAPGASKAASAAARGDACDAFRDAAAAIGRTLCRDALWAGERCAWYGPWSASIDGRLRTCHQVFGPDLYLGSSGVAFFLAQLATTLDEHIVRRTARAAMWRALDIAIDEIPAAQRLSVYNGLTGIALAGLHVARALETVDGAGAHDDLRAAALALVDDIETWSRDLWDVMAGVAGAIPALLRMVDDFGGPDRLRAIAVALGDHMLATAARGDEGWSWGPFPTGVNRERDGRGSFGNLTGFSHGAGGVGWALVELFAATGETRFRDAAREAFRYERHWLRDDIGNWLDLRDPADLGEPNASSPTHMRGWCHGAPGLALARLRAWQVLGEPVDRAEAEMALATTRQALGPGPEISQNNDCLCHGRLGNAEVLQIGADVLDRPDDRAAAIEIGWQGIEETLAMHLPWPCGTRGQTETPGLMTGLAGIGHGYLRLADPATTPSVLLLAPADALRAAREEEA